MQSTTISKTSKVYNTKQ